MAEIKLGLKENRGQFTLLVTVNAFVGGMIGMERSILSKIADAEFHIAAKTAILSFIIAFGIVKAITNYFTGTLANKIGRKNLLVTGWIVGIPVPFILMYSPNWDWIVAANVLLGVNQGLTWSSTVMMKIDLVGEKQRGLAMGLNECAGYVALSVIAFLTGWIAGKYGLRPYPFYLGAGLAFLGFFSSWLFVKDTKQHVQQESASSNVERLKNIFLETTWKNRILGSVTQAGLVNNVNDGMIWGALPILLASKNFSIQQIGIITAIYPAVWGIGQVITGKMADQICKKDMIFWGMVLQGCALILLVIANTFIHFILVSILLGWGTAIVYPTFLAAIADNTHPHDRAKSLGVFRCWRDLGYAIGAIITGIIADAIGINYSIVFIGILTLLSGLIVYYRMRCSSANSIRLKRWLFRGTSGKGVGVEYSCNAYLFHNCYPVI